MKVTGTSLAIISALMFSYLLFLNALTILFLLKILTGIHVPILVLMIVISVTCCVFFLRRGKYNQIRAMFDNEKKVRKKRKTLCVLYMVFSFVVNIIMLYVLGTLGLI